ncbi:TRAP transporter large permease [Calderihabitans maritimus]|uniref:TRAP transporter, DctM subunit n=1 Tax=Calderihabitans maritimus TaxID=1246530 RepID=A0A1Z5HTF5_9FIRM|nr:TRAP transporter large permease subunit [Calderihabitans maritimus]GAW92809.1 TRAP transporter, DctM subunit [Calderihabitans maritimus]
MVLTLFGAFVVLILLNVPIAFSLAVATTLIFIQQGNFALFMIPQRMFTSLDSFTLMAIPFFVFSGVLLSRGGVSKYLINWLRTLLGHTTGGLSVVAIAACMIFAAISGSSPATAAAIGSIVIPGMLEAGYDKRYSMGIVAAGGTLGILIPPSIALIIYGVVAEESIGKLFMAGVIPGILLGLILITAAVVIAKRKGFGKQRVCTWGERLEATKKAIWGAMLPVIILGSIYTGIATPTEAAAVSVVYALFVAIFVYKEITWKDIRPILVETASITSMIFMIIAGAMLFALLLTSEQVPQVVAQFIGENFASRWGFLIAVNIMFFIMGTFLEAVSIILITLPILLPVIKQLGIDPIHFAIIMTINMELAMITPPVGLNLFVVSGVAKEPLGEVVRGVLPFLIMMIVGLFIIMAFPKLSLYLPSLM